MQTLGRHHPGLLNVSPSFDEEDDYSTDRSLSQSMNSIQSSMTGSFMDDSVGEPSPDSFQRTFKPYGANNKNNPTKSFQSSLSTLGLAGLGSSNRRSSMPFPLHSPGFKAKKKADIDRAKRTIERLNLAEMQLKMREGCTDDANVSSSKKGKKTKEQSRKYGDQIETESD